MHPQSTPDQAAPPCKAPTFSGGLCTKPRGHDGHHFHESPWAVGLARFDSPAVTITRAAVEQAASRERVASLAEDAGCDPVWLVVQVLTALQVEVTP